MVFKGKGGIWQTALCIVVIAFCCPAIAAQAPAGQPQVAPSNPASFLANFQGLALVDQNGNAFEASVLKNQTTLFNFIFTGCGSICPMQTKELTKVYQELPSEIRSQIRFVSISIDPGNDTPAKLHSFAKTFGADVPEWFFLTGESSDIASLTERLHIFDETDDNPANRPEIHRTTLWLVDSNGRMLQRYRGDPIDKKRLVRELTQVSSLNVSAKN